MNNEQCLPPCCNQDQSSTTMFRLVALLSVCVKRIRKWISMRRSHQANRRTYKRLIALNDSTLKDIGLTRGDVTWASKLPDSVSAATELEIISRRRE